MSSGRDRERASRSTRTNEYFVPKDGIDREVITADICRYLGNDALVRPGVYENPQTGVAQQGYFINAYRNLTSEMIQDLRADSDRWAAERRQRGQPSNVEYRSSTTHQSRQYYGPSEPPVAPASSQAYAAPGGYATSAGPSAPSMYESTYSTSQYTPQASYGNEPGYSSQNDYYPAANLVVDKDGRQHVAQPGSSVPRSGQAQPQYGTAYPPGDSRAGYSPYPGQGNPSPVYAQPAQQQPAGFYDHAPPAAGTYESGPGMYDTRGYQNQAQAPVPSTSSHSGSRRERSDRESERDSRHHRSSRR